MGDAATEYVNDFVAVFVDSLTTKLHVVSEFKLSDFGTYKKWFFERFSKFFDSNWLIFHTRQVILLYAMSIIEHDLEQMVTKLLFEKPFPLITSFRPPATEPSLYF